METIRIKCTLLTRMWLLLAMGNDKMIIPIRCWSCGKPIGHLWEQFNERLEKGEDRKKAMDELGLERYCCRAMFLGHVDLIDTVAQFKKF